MSDIKITYDGDLRTTATHLKSGSVITTDAPIDNRGKGEEFSPTDLFATALGACMLTIMGITADTHGFKISGSIIKINKVMGKSPRRVSHIKVIIDVPGDLNEKQKQLLIKAAHHCPVSKSIHEDIKEEVIFNFI